jgi:two-component system osmolarity sensor histidine kinase EnvZ
MAELASHDSLRVQPRTANDHFEPLPNTCYWDRVKSEITKHLGPGTLVAWSVNTMPGIWVSFEIGEDPYWMMANRDELCLRPNSEWLSWTTIALLLALLGSAISVRFVNRPLAQLGKAAQQMASGAPPSMLPERGPREIRDTNIAFNRMARSLLQTRTDREIMLAGISHDLRTPLTRMRLEIEMSDVDEQTRQAIDEDLAQIDHTIGQLMEYARPAGALPANNENISQALYEIFERERLYTESVGGDLSADIAADLQARISAHDLKRIVNNLIENARRYGGSPSDGKVRIHMSARAADGVIVIEISDQGPGIAEEDVARLLRPFSRGELARTGGTGAGLGLAIVERLLNQVGGQLKLMSKPGTGLTARIELPSLKA